MKNRTLVLLTVSGILVPLAVISWAGIAFRHTREAPISPVPTLKTLGEADAIATVRDSFPELRGYPSDNLPPRSIRTERDSDGWFVAFVQEGSGIPIIDARCFHVGNDRSVSEREFVSADGSVPGDFSAKECRTVGVMIGGDRDAHGCIGSAGYSWCGEKNKCLRVWEEDCPSLKENNEACAVETCHGLDITCGSDSPRACTDMYALGDKCLRYAKCGVRDGTCRQVEDSRFTECASCVRKCVDSYGDDAMKQFECEGRCE